MSNRQDRPLAKKLLHALGLLALALFLLYVAVQFVLIFHLQDRDRHPLHAGRKFEPDRRCGV